MNLFIAVILILIFLFMPVYYISVVSSTYYKMVYKNKSNIKFQQEVSSISVYSSVIFIMLLTIAFGVYSYFNNIPLLFTLLMLLIDFFVFACIKLASTKFYIFDNYIVSKNNYIEFTEIKNIVLKQTDKANIYEVQVVSKSDLNSCPLKIEDTKSFIKDLRTLISKNIKITEVLAK